MSAEEQSMDYKNIFIIIAFAVLALAVFFYIIGSSADQPMLDNNQPTKPLGDIMNQELAPGVIGETIAENGSAQGGAGEIVTSPVLPKDIFSTTGVVLEIKQDSIVIQSDGHSFADGVGRELTCQAQSGMFVIDEDKIKHQGIESLSVLKIGDEILIKSEENIRGKIEFTIKNIKIIN